jgi:hypothetical protein
MQIIARIKEIKLPQSGESKNGTWKKQEIIVESIEQFPKIICITIWGERMNEYQLETGYYLKIDFDIESREFNEKWYTDVKAWKIEILPNKTVESTPLNSNEILNTKIDTAFSDDDVFPF